MSDWKTLEDWGTALRPPTAAPVRLRTRVLTGVAAPSAAAQRVQPRWGWRLGIAGGLAAAVTAGVLGVQVLSVGDRPPVSSASAAQVLEGAARHAESRPAVTVRGDQFVYVESITTGVSRPEGVEPTGGVVTEAKSRQVWLSADGTRDGLVRERARDGSGGRDIAVPGCRDGLETHRKGGKQVQVPCEPSAHYVGDLPTDPDAMLAYLKQRGGDTKNPADQDAFTAAAGLIREGYLPPAALAAVFEALATLPSVQVVGDVTDEAGRAGVAVAITEVQGNRTELIFDRESFAFLGERSVLVRDQDGLPAGQVMSAAAVLSVAVVDQVGRTS